MKKYLISAAAAIGIVLLVIAHLYFIASPGEKLLRQARSLERKHSYIKAFKRYKGARKLLLEEGRDNKADEARLSIQKMEKICLSYPHTADDVMKISKERWPGIKEGRVRSWMEEGKIDSIRIDGRAYYFDDFPNTVKHQNPDLLVKDSDGSAIGKYSTGLRELFGIVFRKEGREPFSPYSRPRTYAGTQTLNVPRTKLPDKGILKLWFPLPVLIGCQPQVEIISISPDKYFKYPPTIDSDIGLLYAEVPLEELNENLYMRVKYRFRHYEQNFNVDPESIGEYDRRSDIYRQYTASRGDIQITSDIRRRAREVAGDEKNPYLIAKKMYYYVVDETTYSHVPHLALDVLGIPESVYVHEKRFGDCGAQSMYFCALLRSLGVPARATGGWQLIPGISGGHFWAEFYLPNYGWVPADTSVGQLANYFPDMTDRQRKDYKAFYFAGQDPFRWIIQKDVDVPLIPPADEPIFLSIAVQSPAALCDTMEEIPGVVIEEHWKIDTVEVKR